MMDVSTLHYHITCKAPGCNDEVRVWEPTMVLLWLDYHVYPLHRACFKIECMPEREDKIE